MTTTAPHLVRAERFVLPLYDGSRGRTVMIGYRLGDLLRMTARTPRRVLPGPSRLSAAKARALVPALREYGLSGALSSWDGRVVDDARLVVAVARTAAAHGARVITRCRALGLSAKGARVRDELTGSEFTIDARAVINATGVWAAELSPSIRLRPSRGTHLVLSPGTLGDLRAGLHVPLGGNRFALVLPQADGRVYVGLTDEPVDTPVPDVPEAPEGDVTFLLGVLNSVLDEPVPRDRVAGAYAGLRPLLDGAGRTSDLSRRHAVITDDNDVITIVGGKLTTYRRMAEDAVNAACPDAPRSRTARLPLVGASTEAVRAPWRLIERYGAEATAVQDLMRQEPELAEPVALGITRAELLWAVRHEGALDAGDVLDRRTRIGLVAADRAAALPAVEDLLARTRVSDA
jgi:glycerol-3-phosphate dehydrogenase